MCHELLFPSQLASVNPSKARTTQTCIVIITIIIIKSTKRTILQCC